MIWLFALVSYLLAIWIGYRFGKDCSRFITEPDLRKYLYELTYGQPKQDPP